MSNDSPIPKRLREARTLAGLSQEKLGVLAGIDELSANPRMNQYENGVHAPNYGTMKRIAKALKIPTPYFYAEEDGMAKWILQYKE